MVPASQANSRMAVAHLREPLLELEQVVGLRLGELPVQPALAQPEQHLLGRLLVDLVGVGQRVELREQRRQLAVGLGLAEEVRAGAPVELVVEVLGAELLEVPVSFGCAATPASALALEALTPRRAAAARSRRGARWADRRERRLRLRRSGRAGR